MALYKLEFAILTPGKHHCGVYQEGFPVFATNYPTFIIYCNVQDTIQWHIC